MNIVTEDLLSSFPSIICFLSDSDFRDCLTDILLSGASVLHTYIYWTCCQASQCCSRNLWIHADSHHIPMPLCAHLEVHFHLSLFLLLFVMSSFQTFSMFISLRRKTGSALHFPFCLTFSPSLHSLNLPQTIMRVNCSAPWSILLHDRCSHFFLFSPCPFLIHPLSLSLITHSIS